VEVRRHLTIVLPDGPFRDAIEVMRTRWDPVMAAGVPAHVSVVYPEEITDEALLLQRAAVALEGLRSFPLDIRGVVSADESRGVVRGVVRGVYLGATDRAGVLTGLRQHLLTPPFASLGYPLHVTIVHPRTSRRGPDAFAALRSDPIAGSFIVSELRWTETSPEGMTALQGFELLAPRVQQVAAVLRRAGKILLCHRHPRREYFPDTWDLPGGHVEPAEHAAEGLARELHEELGIVVGELPDTPTTVLSDDELGVDLSVWFVDRWDGEPTNAAPAEHDALEWCGPSDWVARPLAHPAYLELLADAVSDAAPS
jgi:8-oxo-dGTP diphosphatase